MMAIVCEPQKGTACSVGVTMLPCSADFHSLVQSRAAAMREYKGLSLYVSADFELTWG